MERATLTIEQVATRLGIGRNLCYELARQDKLPVTVIRLGKRLVVSKAALDRVLDSNEFRFNG